MLPELFRNRVNIRSIQIPWKWWRRAAQLLCLFAFLWLFRKTESDGTGTIAFGANILFRLDPLAGASAMLAGRRLIMLFWPAAVVLALSARPEVMLLDEPAGGLDPIARRSLLNGIVEALSHGDGCTVLFSTHLIGDLQRVADAVVHQLEEVR